MEHLYNLVNLLNEYTEENLEIENKIRDLICYISDNSEYMKNELYKSVIFEAAEKLRLFGYIKGTNKISLDEFNEDRIFDIKHLAIQNHYKSKVYKNNLLDRRQKEVIDKFMSLENKRILVSAPTSFGKTFLLREIIFMNRERYNNILLIFPTIALLNENTANIYELINKFDLDYKIVNNVYTGIDNFDKHIFILTPERTLKLLSDNTNLKIDFFFFDEIYKIDEDFNRNENSKNINQQNDVGNRAKAFRIALYLLSKTVDEFYLAGPYLNLGTVKDGMKIFLDKNHITPIQFNFEPTLRIEYDAWTSNCIEKHPILGDNKKQIYTNVSKTKKHKIKGITEYIKENKLGQAIFYCATPSKSMEYTKEIVNLFDINDNKIPKNFIDHLKKKYNIKYGNKNSSTYWSLVHALEHGVGIHHGKFPKYIQNEILRLYNEGKFNYLFCTSTIIEGVNTNAKNIIVINNSVGKSTMTAFTLKNIKGRAGRYYHHNIGRIFYTDKVQRKIEESDDMKLNFQTFDDVNILDCDIDNADIEDLSENNKILKQNREKNFSKRKLPDEVFIKNRLFSRDIQERFLNYLLLRGNFNKFSLLIKNSNNIHLFLKHKLINTILESFASNAILTENKVKVYIAILSTYTISGTLGILKYHINNLIKNNPKPDKKMDSAYIKTFEQIRNIIEYEVPKLLCLFEALFQQAGKLLNYDMEDFNMSTIIRYFELGITTELGLFLVEFGFPIDTIRKIENTYSGISKLSAIESINHIHNHPHSLSKVVDSYELELYTRATNNLSHRNNI